MMENIVKARSYIIFIAGLIVAFSAVAFIESRSEKISTASSVTILPSSRISPTPAPRSLTPQELDAGRIAWKYFENNTDSETGLANSSDKYPATTMWDTASYLMALIAAQKLEIISQQEFDQRTEKALAALERMPLFDATLPNKSYNTKTLSMVDYGNKVTPRGIGWSALDIGRLLVPFDVIVWSYPQHTPTIRKILSRWNTTPLVTDGVLFGAMVSKDGQSKLVQEGRLGYEEYAAKSFTLIGLDAGKAGSYTDHLSYVNIYNIQIPYDNRNPKEFGGTHNYVVSEPYVLDGLEFGWDGISREFSWRIYRAQEERFLATGVLTAVTEDHIDRAPYFVYNTVYSDGKVWNTITDKGVDASSFRSLSVKAAFAWHALYGTEYTKKLMAAVLPLRDPERGWYAGFYEESKQPNKAISANTNAVILESLAFIKNGKFIQYH